MQASTVKLLLIEDDPDDVALMEELLAEGGEALSGMPIVSMARAKNLEEAAAAHASSPVDIILSDLRLLDSKGIDTVLRLRDLFKDIPLIAITGLDDIGIALESLKLGVQDYLVKGRITGELLMRSLVYSTERFKLLEALRSLALLDELTGLYNRRGFFALAETQFSIAKRRGRKIVVVYADLDRMKTINDNYGHKEGDRALIEAAGILRSVFRSSDIIGRIGGDEFAVLAIEASDDSADIFERRIAARIREINATGLLPYEVSISVGSRSLEAADATNLEDVLAGSDRLMYEKKRSKGAAR